VIGALALGLTTLKQKSQIEQTPRIELSSSTLVTEPEKSELEPLDPATSIAAMNVKFRNAQRRPQDKEFLSVIAELTKLIKRWPESHEAILAREMMSRCYTELADFEKARAEFVEYARATEASIYSPKPGMIAARLLLQEAIRLAAQHDFTSAIPYCDLIISSYPNSDAAEHAQMEMAKYYEVIKQPNEAIAVLTGLIKNSRDTGLIRSAYRRMATLYFNLGDKAGANAVLTQHATLDTPEDDAYVQFHRGLIAYAEGQSHYAEALFQFKKVVKEHPNDAHAVSANGMIAVIKQKVLSGMEKVED
jgi:outer membrane protein assembly factor BamD (BamD/ComL family)